MVKSETFISSFLKDEGGASAAEYVLILALIGGAITVAAIALGNAISGELNTVATCIVNGDGTGC